MQLFCSVEIIRALEGVKFPASKAEIIYQLSAKKDISESAIVLLNQLDDQTIFKNANEICENIGIVCDIEVYSVIKDLKFPVRKEEILLHAQEEKSSDYVISSLSKLSGEFVYNSIDDICKELA
ncbi:MAG: DUF2795 domain-containing protein [Actinobacteria bacterium]|nr:DUF2795 domain-containing protein [Actinomycetota bacterium]